MTDQVKVSHQSSDFLIRNVVVREGVTITSNLGDDFDPAYILLLTGCDCFFTDKIQTLKLFSFLICLPLYINQMCKYCTSESYVWIVLYRLRLATKNKFKKKTVKT